MKEYDKEELELGYGNRFVRFQDLLKHRIHNILLVSSLYDSFILSEDGQLYEMLLNEYIGLNLSHTPGLTRVSSGRAALQRIREEGGYDLIITTLRLEDMSVLDFARELRAEGNDVPLVLLTYDSRELNDLIASGDVACFDKVFMWLGNFRILLAIVKCIEDQLNIEHDTNLVGVQSIILIEDSVKFYSSYLPLIYTELMRQSQNVISEGVNLAHKILRMRARPKIILCHSYEEARSYLQTYHETILGVISDVKFPREGKSDPEAGIEFAKMVKLLHPDIPVLLQSNNLLNEKLAYAVGASFLHKKSPVLLNQLSNFIQQYFSFGDFVFRMPDGTEVGRASDLRELKEGIRTVPDESLLFHSERNHFSNWLKARTEFLLAHKLRPQKVSDYSSTAKLRKALVSYLGEYQIAQLRGVIVDFDPDTFDPDDGFSRIGGGSLGGKGRGLAFASTLIDTYRLDKKYRDIDISVPPTIIIGTDVFDEFLKNNNLLDFALNCDDDEEIDRRFLKASLPGYVEQWLKELLKKVKYPLAVRSSSLLEDSQYQPFAGVYRTYMLPNNHNRTSARLEELLCAIKRVYASTYSKHAKGYIKATPYRLEEEKMGVIIQKLIGCRHEKRFYPDFSGVARSHNFYPIEPMQSQDGIVSVALGLGATVVEGGATIRFCPSYPKHLVQFSTVDDSLNYSQKNFYALELPSVNAKYDHRREATLLKLGLDVAEADGVLGAMGSTYSPENNAVHDGISRVGVRLVSFAPILKSDFFPLPQILRELLDVCHRGLSNPVEMEFSVNLSVPQGEPKEFRVLQLRPMVISHEVEQLQLNNISEEKLVCHSGQVLGHGVIENIRDIIVVDKEKYERARSIDVAREVGQFNLELQKDERPYLLIGVGRWGSADPWLGIPVQWDEISGAAAIIEAGFKDMKVTPSQGTHFFQNLTAFQIGYFTVNSTNPGDFIDWRWMKNHKAASEKEFTRLLRFDNPITIKMDGHSNEGIIIKPADDGDR